MSATLRILEESEYGPESRDIAIADGATITLRRHRQGADVLVEQNPCAPPALSSEPAERRLIREIGVTFGNEGFAGLILIEGDGREHHYSVADQDLAALVRLVDRQRQPVVEAPGRPDLRDMGAASLDAARARLINAEAELKELAVAGMKRPPDDRPFQADRWSVVSDSGRGTVTATARDLEGRELQIESAPDRARWLAEHLLSGTRHIETAER